MVLTERTTVTIGLVIALLGGAGFVTNIHFQTQANAQAISELKYDLKDELKALRLELKELRLELKQDRIHK